MDYYYVTGTSRGLGRSIAESLLQDPDATVIGIARGEGLSHERYRHCSLDLSDLDAVAAYAFEPRPDARRAVLVNNAAVFVIKRFGECDPKTIVDSMNINLVAPLLLTNAFIKAYGATAAEMLVCNLTAGSAHMPVDGAALYSAPKAGLELTTQIIQEEALVSNDRLRAICINPGSMDTGMQAYMRSFDTEDWKLSEAARGWQRDGLLNQPEVVAAGIAAVLRNPDLAPDTIFKWTEAVAG
jgi:benzil reductase ((S)-benzoin forming)